MELADLEQRLRDLHRPEPVMSRTRERELTDRQRNLLDQLEDIFFTEGFATLTMADLATRLRCSLRTLYTLAGSRDELILAVVDRSLWRVGRAASDMLTADAEPVEVLRAYLRATTVAVSQWTPAFMRDLAEVPAARRLERGHHDYLFDVTRTLLDVAVERREIASVDTAAIARALSELGRMFTRPEVAPTLRSAPKQAADEVVDVVLKGLSPVRA